MFGFPAQTYIIFNGTGKNFINSPIFVEGRTLKQTRR
jgi:hypothetical protein